ncbi:hypothetical protein LTR37_014912 [Vermiconidia calcicola]|uniref:Uncharacterized protein n=1 Tax=Vermiconidia calcicola TaxID=1690605 RepID=A0ACC3MSB4_9PEZI|nr:hypothetical protein LTR37_014912 [Vermiconidia calcicola]
MARSQGSDPKEDYTSNESLHEDEGKALPPDVERNAAAPSGDNEEKPAPPSVNQGPGPPPDGGLQAWLQVLAGFCLFFNTWGILNTFGVYQTYYESGQLWTETSSNISWIGSIQSVMVLVVGAFTGPIFDRGHLRLLLIVGTFGVVFGHMMLSLCTTFWQSILAQGFVIGLGGGCLYIPAVALLPTWFSSKLGLAIGLAASGSSMGGIIYPIMFYKLIDQVGFAWSVRILGFTTLATLMIPIFIMKLRVKPPKARSLIDWSAFTDLPFMTLVLGSLIGFIGLYTGFFYTSYYGQESGLTNASLSFYLVPILNAGSVFGRTLPNMLSDKIGPLNVIAPGAFMVGLVLLCYLAASSVGGIVVLALLFGFFSGIFIALPPVLFVALTKDKSKIGTRMGMGFTLIGIGVLCGGPGGGGILGTDRSNLHWTGTWVYAGVTCLAAGVVFTVLRVMRAGWKLGVKV